MLPLKEKSMIEHFMLYYKPTMKVSLSFSDLALAHHDQIQITKMVKDKLST